MILIKNLIKESKMITKKVYQALSLYKIINPVQVNLKNVLFK